MFLAWLGILKAQAKPEPSPEAGALEKYNLFDTSY
jgi:hypothetical protein